MSLLNLFTFAFFRYYFYLLELHNPYCRRVPNNNVVILLETKTARQDIVVSEEELVQCRICRKMFTAYKVKTFGQEYESTICKECREKY